MHSRGNAILDVAPVRPLRIGRALVDAGARGVASAARYVADLLVPPVCVACRTPVSDYDALCPDCWITIDFIRPPLCDRLGLPMPYDTGGPVISAAALATPPAYDRARAVARHGGTMRELIHALKYADQLHGARLFGRWLREAAADLLPGADLLVPIPLARSRLWHRRYNQAAVLAQAMSRCSGVPDAPLALTRKRRTTSQVGLTPDQRRRNGQGAFEVPAGWRRRIDGRAIILVDDVITTGATAEAATRALRQAGARRIDIVALALVTDALPAAD
jgi:ComF family protein